MTSGKFSNVKDYFVDVSINSLLPKIDKLRDVAILIKTTLIGIYDLLCCERNKHGGRVAYNTRNYLSYNIKSVIIIYPE